MSRERVQEMFEIACRYATAMADAMVLACLERAHELGVSLKRPAPRPSVATARGTRPSEDVDWERMVRANCDTASNHV